MTVAHSGGSASEESKWENDSHIALTASRGEYNQHQALNAGFEQRLSKLADSGEFVQIIATLTEP